MQIQTPRTVETDWKAAISEAVDRNEPVFRPISAHVDDRGWSLMNLLTGVLSNEGQVNFSLQNPGVIKAWHRHRFQTDFWTCVQGHLKAGVFRESDQTAWSIVFGEMRPGVLIIPPTLWHGAATIGASPAGLLYYVTKAYNPAEPDEERAAYDCFKGFPWEIAHR